MTENINLSTRQSHNTQSDTFFLSQKQLEHYTSSSTNNSTLINELDTLVDTIKELYNKYEHDLFMRGKLVHYIKINLPSFLTNTSQVKINREERKKTLIKLCDIFNLEYPKKLDILNVSNLISELENKLYVSEPIYKIDKKRKHNNSIDKKHTYKAKYSKIKGLAKLNKNMPE